MIANGKSITTRQKTQVCVIGSGPAGITAAWQLGAAGYDVILLDGSRQLDYSMHNYYRQSWPDKVKLYNGVADGVFAENEPQFLIRPYNGDSGFPTERERVYGGTSTHWGGQSRPLDPIDFEKRPGSPACPDFSGWPGWPISRSDLDPFYAKAVTFNNLVGDYGTSGANFTAEYWVKQMQQQNLQAAVPQLKNFDADMYQFMGSQWLNFATRTFDGKSTIGNSSVRVIVNATVLNIVEQNGSVQYLNVASMNDDPTNPQKATEFTVQASVYILACGSVENARQLLLSGVGNKFVGRYFMCHPLTSSGVISTNQSYLSPAQSNLMGGSGWNPPPGTINNIEGRFTVNSQTATSQGIGRCWFWANGAGGSAQMYMEMAPNFNSYVGLTTTVDPVFGQQQTHIHWELSDQDKVTYETNCKLFQQATNNSISFVDWEDLAQQWVVNGHHIGTTRMSASASEGAVDKNLKLYGVDNLYVAGASVFPTTGVSNPTMTIVTLSLRLADYLKNSAALKT